MMTPQERQLVNELFDRLERLEAVPRDSQAERAIADGLARAPNAIYPLVQTVLLQDEALKQADARVRELSGQGANTPAGGFLDPMRQAHTSAATTTSVPAVRPAATESDPRWNRGGAFGTGAPPSEGSFLGTAAASVAGVIGGALLLNTFGSMFGHHGASASAAMSPPNSPGENSAAGSGLSREAGLNDIGRDARADTQPAGLFDSDGSTDASDIDDDFGDADGDFGDFGGADSD